MTLFADQSLTVIAAAFAVAALVILTAGTYLTRLADRFADMTGIGEALTGAVLLGAMTSLAGSITSIVAASNGRAEFAVSNAIGGIAAQTAFLAFADIAYRRGNLEHAAASMENLTSGALLIILLSIPLCAYAAPEYSLWGVHPATLILFGAYIGGLRLTHSVRLRPMWLPERTPDTREDVPDEPQQSGQPRQVLIATLLGLGILVALAGYVIAQTGMAIIDRTELRAGVVGTLLTAVTTSTPELVTTIAAVRRGALTLAVGGIVGGNTFDVLFFAFSDIAYTNGSIYHAISASQVFTIALGLLMTGILLLGLLRRERYGIGNIGFESAFLIVVYGLGVAIIATL